MGLFMSFTLEKVRFVSLANTDAQACKASQKKITPTEDKGKVNGDTGTVAIRTRGKGPSPNAVKKKWDIFAGNWAGAQKLVLVPGAQ